MARLMKFFYVVYAIVFVLIVLAAVYSAFGGFEHGFMDPGM